MNQASGRKSGQTDLKDPAWEKRIGSLRGRSTELSASKFMPELEVATRFTAAAPVWAHHRKSIERVEEFLFDLQRSGRYQAHYECMKAWGSAVHSKPASFHGLVQIAHMPRILKSESTTNDRFSANDSFETLNGYLAIDPLGCLQQPGLLSGSWAAGISTEKNADAAALAIMSAFYRYGDQIDRLKKELSKGRVSYVNSFFDKLTESAGLGLEELLDRMPDRVKPSPIISRYYNELVDYSNGTSGATIPNVMTNLHSLMQSSGLFEVCMRVGVFSTNAHDKYLEPKRKYITHNESDYYHWVIASKYTRVTDLLVMIVPDRLGVDHIEAMDSAGLAKPYVKALQEEDRQMLISKGLIPAKLLSKGKDRGRLLETDLGI